MAERSRFQEKVIRNHYKNADAIALQRLQELITDLYLAEGKKRAQVWGYIQTHLAKLKVSQKEIDNLVEKDNAELVANTVKRLMSKQS